MLSQQQFDQEYQVIRSLLLHRKVTIAYAKAWLRTRGIKAAIAQQKEYTDWVDRVASLRADRDYFAKDEKEQDQDQDQERKKDDE